MKTNRIIAGWLALAAFSLATSTAFAQGAAFSYQGRLNDGGSPATGIYDLRFTVCDALASGSVVAGPKTNSATVVTNGLFAVTLDFGNGVFTGSNRWLEIAARTNGAASFTALSPRQPILPVPYAIMANSASNLLGTLPAAQLGAGMANISISGNAATATTAANVTGSVSAGQLTGAIGSAQIASGAVGNSQLGLCKISGGVICAGTDPTHTFVYVRGTSALAYVGDPTADGYPYQLTLLEPGTYTVVAKTSSGYEVSSPVTVAAGQTVTNVNFSGANLLTDLNNCGACSNVCNLANATPSCVSGSCQITSCNSSYTNCDGIATNGCEINSSTNANNCGGCGVVCSGSHVTTVSCAGGACNGTCTAGWGDCDANKQANGCETDIAGNANNCGGCGVVCSSSHVTKSCSGGACNGACAAGWGDCDANKQANGCETDINSSVNNCGACGIVCSSQNMSTTSCAAGNCIGACNTGWGNCDSNLRSNGCETNINTDNNNCGTCGHVCATGHPCVSGICQ